MKEVVRRAVHAYLAEEPVDPTDPILTALPVGASGRKGHDTARQHDAVLYGPIKRR